MKYWKNVAGDFPVARAAANRRRTSESLGTETIATPPGASTRLNSRSAACGPSASCSMMPHDVTASNCRSPNGIARTSPHFHA